MQVNVVALLLKMTAVSVAVIAHHALTTVVFQMVRTSAKKIMLYYAMLESPQLLMLYLIQVQ